MKTKISDSEKATLFLDISEDGDASLGILSEKGMSTCRFCTMMGGDRREASRIIRRHVSYMIQELNDLSITGEA